MRAETSIECWTKICSRSEVLQHRGHGGFTDFPLVRSWNSRAEVYRNGINAVTALQLIQNNGPSVLISGDDDGGISVKVLQAVCSAITLDERLKPIQLHTKAVTGMVSLSDNRGFASAGDDAIINYVLLSEGKAPEKCDAFPLYGHAGSITSISKSDAATPSILLTSGMDATLRLWDVRSGSNDVLRAKVNGPVNSACLHPVNANIVACAVKGDDAMLQTWDMRHVKGYSSSVAAALGNDKHKNFIDRSLYKSEIESPVRKRRCLSDQSGDFFGENSECVDIWSKSDKINELHRKKGRCANFSVDFSLVELIKLEQLDCIHNSHGRVWLHGDDLKNRRTTKYRRSCGYCFQTITREMSINHVSYSLDGRHLLTASQDSILTLWDTSIFQLSECMLMPIQRIWCPHMDTACSPLLIKDRIFEGSLDGGIRVHQLLTRGSDPLLGARPRYPLAVPPYAARPLKALTSTSHGDIIAVADSGGRVAVLRADRPYN